MTLKESIRVSDAEWDVLRVVWANNMISAKEIILILSETKSWKASTVKTLLGRLVKKQAIAVKAAGNKFLYYPLITEEFVLEQNLTDILAHICNTEGAELIIRVINQVDLTKEDVDKIKEALLKKEKVAVQICHCVHGQCTCQKG